MKSEDVPQVSPRYRMTNCNYEDKLPARPRQSETKRNEEKRSLLTARAEAANSLETHISSFIPYIYPPRTIPFLCPSSQWTARRLFPNVPRTLRWLQDRLSCSGRMSIWMIWLQLPRSFWAFRRVDSSFETMEKWSSRWGRCWQKSRSSRVPPTFSYGSAWQSWTFTNGSTVSFRWVLYSLLIFRDCKHISWNTWVLTWNSVRI